MLDTTISKTLVEGHQRNMSLIRAGLTQHRSQSKGSVWSANLDLTEVLAIVLRIFGRKCPQPHH